MTVKILFFGLIKDELGVSNVDFSYDGNNLETLKEALYDEYETLKSHTHAIAVNENITRENIDINDGDEIAFMPAFSGG